MIAALEAVAAAGSYRPAGRPEAHLVSVVRAALPSSVPGEPRYSLPGWTRRPGGVDLVFDAGLSRTLVECKVDKPAESLWDALKLVDILHDEGLHAAFLLYDALDTIWSKDRVAPLFALDTEIGMRELIERWPKAWGDLLWGGDGIRPQESVARLRLTPVGAVALAPGRTVRLLQIAPTGGREHYDPDGWPDGYEPPDDLRVRSRRVPSGVIGPGEATDPCHGYPWYGIYTQSRLAAVVPSLDDDSYACLRRRLVVEKRWTEPELQARVDPLREPPK